MHSAARTAVLIMLLSLNILLASAQVSTSPDQKTLTIDDASGQQVLAYAKDVIVLRHAEGVLAIGGDITVEGRVDGDVAAIGGSVVQRDGAFIGGDVFVIGGKYTAEGPTPPLRTAGKETVMYAGYEEELRDLSQNPSQIFSPAFSFAFLAQRTLSVLFWFVVTMALTTIAPGAVSRSIARFNLSTLKVVGLGLSGLVITTVVMIASLEVLPNYLTALLGLMAFALITLAYVFGRVTLHVSFGQLIQKRLFGESKRSETLAVFIGVLVWTVFLSIPYVWSLGVIGLFSAGIGLVLTGRAKSIWKSA